MIGVRPVENAAPFQNFEDPVKTTCIGRIWSAVVDFFTRIVIYISDAMKTTWNAAKNVFGFSSTTAAPSVTGVEAPPNVIAVPATGTLGEKLALYRNIPQDSQGLIARSIDIFKDSLRRKEEANIAALPPGAPVPDAQRPLKTFNEEWELMMNVVDIAKATVRGYVFSDSNATSQNIPFFRQVIRQDRGRYDPPVRHPQTNELLHVGGYEMIDVYEDRTARLRQLRATFNRLDNREKEIVLDKTDFDGINQMQISANAKAVLQGIADISNFLHQHNAPFMAALQAVHGRTNF